ncbi:hypothetical protein PV328_001253 [Microctonus aethiopoides]|uniref:Uncharacterized protein n=1 Tax=Microctonus aethiopoides TaxID=144406 RepID=A0AA39KXA7_9HYME|nr:hypothetical protein PV328_001253 [Microctonus aethiopoides]
MMSISGTCNVSLFSRGHSLCGENDVGWIGDGSSGQHNPEANQISPVGGTNNSSLILSLRQVLVSKLFGKKDDNPNGQRKIKTRNLVGYGLWGVTKIRNQQTTTAEDAATSAAEPSQALANEEHMISSTTSVTIAK